jgi:D-glycero-beta-D-manno-heptose 1-phosphate adenylyltransferase
MSIYGALELGKFIYVARNSRPKVVVGLANGAFDLLHVGHVRYLQEARRTCDFLVVAINSDASVRASKGIGRPIVPENERAEMVAALSCVSAVILFHEETCHSIVRVVKPDYHYKGPDYRDNPPAEFALVQELGGKLVIIGDQKNHGTSDLISKIRQS